MKLPLGLAALNLLLAASGAQSARASSFTCVANPVSLPEGACAFVTIEEKEGGENLLTYSESEQCGVETYRETLPVRSYPLHMGRRYAAENVSLYVPEYGNARFKRVFPTRATLELDLGCGSRAPLAHFPLYSE